MSEQTDDLTTREAEQPDSENVNKFEQFIGGQSGEMTFMMQYHFHGFIPQ
ncbi:manganese catalase family protein [Bacillus niameyensis]|nr:manganese catalase family protein [Bacillus niameyensis]